MKPCDRCRQLNSLRYRIQYDRTRCWILVCPSCWHELSDRNPNYCYGGTWKSRQLK